MRLSQDRVQLQDGAKMLNNGFRKRLVICWPAERLSGSEMEMCSTSLLSYCHF